MKYLIEKLNGVEVEIVHMLTDQGDGRTASVRVLPTGPQFEIHMNWLTPAPTPQPTEPPPGAYLIGETVCVRTADSMPYPWLIVHPEGYTSPQQPSDWKGVWERLGGPDVTIQRLVPEPAKVELPAKFRDPVGEWIEVHIDGSILVGDRAEAKVALDLPQAEKVRLAAAILAGAGA